jgi:hypothetical protein
VWQPEGSRYERPGFTESLQYEPDIWRVKILLRDTVLVMVSSEDSELSFATYLTADSCPEESGEADFYPAMPKAFCGDAD